MTTLLLASSLALVLASPPAHAEAARTITLSGEPLTQKLVSDLAFFYRRETPRPPTFSIVGGGTAGGMADAARGIVDAGLVSRDLTPQDPAGLRFTPLALSAVCLVTNTENPLSNLTRAQVQDIVSGRTTLWNQLPGETSAAAIVPVTFDLASGARTVFESVFLDLTTQAVWQPRTFTASSQMHDFVAATPAALGYIDIAYTRGLHVVPYEGTACSTAPPYAARRTLGLVTRGRPKGEVKRFLAWIKRDPTAKRVIRTRYVVPS